MSKQQLEAAIKIFNILSDNPEVTNFINYLSQKYKVDQSDARKLAKDDDKILEFFFKMSFIKHAHNVSDDLTASKIASAPVVMAEGMKHEIYKNYNFMHYIAVNAIPASVVEQYVNQWVGAGISLNLKDEKGQTPLDYALVKNRIDCVKVLSEGGVDLTQLDSSNGFSPLHKLVQQVKDGVSQPEVIKTWCDLGLPTGTVSVQGWTPLEFAVGLGNVGVVFAFVESGVGSKILDNNTTVLHYCVKHDKVDIISKLKGKVDFNVKDASDAPAITQALVGAKEDIVKVLASGTDLTLADKASGNTILHLLVGAKMFAQAALAVQVGYDGNLKNLAGKSSMDLLVDGIAGGLCTDPQLSSAVVNIFCNTGNCIVEDRHLESITMSNISNKDDILKELKPHFVAPKVEIVAEEPTAAVLDLFAMLGIVPGQGEENNDIDTAGANTEELPQ